MKQRPFNLIEITIAMGVVAIGVVAVVGAFPAAANKSRDAMAESYATGAAGDLLAMIEQQGRKTGQWANWFVTGGTEYLSETVPVTTDREDFAVNPGDTNSIADSQQTVWFKTGAGVPPYKTFKILRYVDNNSNDTYDAGELVDFEAIMVVWREQVSYDGIPANNLPYTIAVRLNAEISWPAQLPYDRRQKAFYATELFKR